MGPSSGQKQFWVRQLFGWDNYLEMIVELLSPPLVTIGTEKFYETGFSQTMKMAQIINCAHSSNLGQFWPWWLREAKKHEIHENHEIQIQLGDDIQQRQDCAPGGQEKQTFQFFNKLSGS